MEPSGLPTAVLPAPSTAGTDGRAALLLIFLLGALLPFQWFMPIGAMRVNCCAADFVILPVALLLCKRWFHSGTLGWWVFLLGLVNLVAWACSINLLAPDAFLREFLKVSACGLFALAGYAIGRQARSERALVYGAIFSALPIAVVGLQSFFTRVPLSFIPDGRVSGPFTDPNAFACYLAMMVALVTTLRVDLVAIPLFLGAGLVSFSRSGLVAIASALALSLTHARVRRYLPILVLAAVAVVTIWSNLWEHTVGYRVMEYQASLEQRKALWRRGLEVVAAHPIIGIGRGNWDIASGQHTIPHNTLLSVAADVGLVGVTVFFLPLLVWLVKGMRFRETRPWAVVLLSSLMAGLAITLDNFRPFWLFTGVLVAQIGLMEQRRAAARREGHAILPAASWPLAQRS